MEKSPKVEKIDEQGVERIDQRVLRDILKAVRVLKGDASDSVKLVAVGKLAAIGAISTIQNPRFREHAYFAVRGLDKGGGS